jgi:putative restriction endonuclease
MNAFRDWLIIRETKRSGGRPAYLAAARVERVERSPKQPDHLNVLIRDRLPFPNQVSLSA